MSVVIASRDNPAGVRRCLQALAAQTIRPSVEVIVVDDGSAHPISACVDARMGAIVRHENNRGVSAARNTGIRLATAPIVAFLDDDCEPEPAWAEELVAGYSDSVLGLGGPLLVPARPGYVAGYLRRNNPLAPLELELAKSQKRGYRFALYLKSQWTSARPEGRRPVLALPTANLSVRRDALVAVGGFDERLRFGAEDEDLCRRLALAHPGQVLVFDPGARVVHHFKCSILDTLRRSRAYGRGSAVMFHKWRSGLTLFPFPLAVLALAALAVWRPLALLAVVVLPQVFYPQGLRAVASQRDARCVADAYLRCTQEFSDDLGLIEGLWRLRHLRAAAVPPGGPAPTAEAGSR